MTEHHIPAVGVIGLGTMGTAIADGLHAANAASAIYGTRRDADAPGASDTASPIRACASNGELAEKSEIIILAVKPYQARGVIEEISPVLEGKVVISICAAVTTFDMRAWSPERGTFIRSMPNTPCLIGEGMTVIARDGISKNAQLLAAERLFAPLGQTAIVDEHLMDAVTGLSGCGPAYVFLIIEALSEAGVKLGIDRRTSTKLAAQTLLGGARMVLERGEHPAKLKDEVTTPAGCTVDALMVMEDGRLRSTLLRGVVAAAERSKALREQA